MLILLCHEDVELFTFDMRASEEEENEIIECFKNITCCTSYVTKIKSL